MSDDTNRSIAITEMAEAFSAEIERNGTLRNSLAVFLGLTTEDVCDLQVAIGDDSPAVAMLLGIWLERERQEGRLKL